MKKILISLLCFGSLPSTFATIFWVTNTDDTGPGSLRQAIEDTNVQLGPDSIYFDIPGEAPHTIMVMDDLPDIIQTTIIDGNTQPANGYTGELPKIVLEKMDQGRGYGLDLRGAASRISGLHLKFFFYGVRFITGAEDFVLEENVFEDNSYTSIEAVRVNGGTIRDNIIGSAPNNIGCNGFNGNRAITFRWSQNILVEGNIITCYDAGVDIQSSSNNVVIGNYIGNSETECSNIHRLGVYIVKGGGNQIGGDNPGEPNVITSTSYAGILIREINGDDVTENNRVSRNILQCNSGAAIMLDGAANNNKAAPLILTADNTLITGTAEPGDIVEVFRHPDNVSIGCTPNHVPQGDLYYGTVTADLAGNWLMAGTFEGEVTATAYDPVNGTSEFSATVPTGTAYESNIGPCHGIVLHQPQAELFAKKLERTIKLEWKESTGEMPARLSIEHSLDEAQWYSIHVNKFVEEGAENFFVDENPASGKNHYRLVWGNEKGEVYYSNIATVYFQADKIRGIVVFPNPAEEFFQISPIGRNRFPKSTMLKLMDLKGRILITNRGDKLAEKMILNLHDLTAGLYILQVSGPDFNFSKKFIKQ